MSNKQKRPDWKPVRLMPLQEQEDNEDDLNENEEPEHFKYGIYYNDNYNYMQHLRSYEEFMNYQLDLSADVKEEKIEPIIRAEFPDFDDEKLPKEVDIPSDDEMWGSDVSDMEDNFVELAGGHKTVHEPPPKKQAAEQQLMWNDTGNPEKMLMMERFLWGDNPNNHSLDPDLMFQDDTCVASTCVSSIRKGRPLTEKEELLEKQFELTMKRTLTANRNMGELSTVSGCSMLSEQLTSAMKLDTDKWKKLVPKTERLLEPLCEEDLKKFKELADNISDPTMEEQDSAMENALKKWVGEKKKNKDDITTIASSTVNLIRKAKNLEMPASTKKKGSSIVSVNEKMSQMSIDDDSDNSAESNLPEALERPESRRKTNETAEERKARKQALKAYKRDRQQVRKEHRNLYAYEGTKFAQKGAVASVIKIDG